MTIRSASLSDSDRLAQLRGAYAEEQKGLEPTDTDFGERFATWFVATWPMSRWQVAEIDGTIVGTVHMFVHVRMPMPGYDPGGWGNVSLVYVQPAHRAAGVGRALILAMEQEARELGLSKLLSKPTVKAAPLYRRCWYEPADSHLVHTIEP